MRIKWWLLFKRGVNTRRDIQLEKIVSEYDAKGGGRERVIKLNIFLSKFTYQSFVQSNNAVAVE